MNKVIKLSFILLFTVLNYFNTAKSCTRAFWNVFEEYMISARNLDFFGPVDPSLIISPRNISRTGGDAKDAAKWVSKYGSVVIYADDVFPMDGMNEKGLAGHTLYYSNGSQVQTDNKKRPSLESSRWLSYILDNFATVKEAVEGIKKVRLVAKMLPIDYASDTKHIAIEDVTGNSAIIEIENGKVNIWEGLQYTVMTNPPSYDQMLQKWTSYADATYDKIPWDLGSTSRFIRTSWNLKNLPKPDNKAQAQGFILSVVNNAAFPVGLPENDALTESIFNKYSKYSKNAEYNKGPGTYWTTLSDLSNSEYHFKSAFSSSQVWVNLNDLDFYSKKIIKLEHFNDYAQNGWEGNILDIIKNSKS